MGSIVLSEVLLQLQALFGIAVLIGLAWLFALRKTNPFTSFTVMGVLLQFSLAAVFLFIDSAKGALGSLSQASTLIEKSTASASEFAFGFLGGAEPPFEVTNPAGLFIFALEVLPLIIFVAALMAVLWHTGLLGLLVKGMGYLLRKSMGVSGAVALGSTSNVFFGQTESLLFIRPYLENFSRSELFAVMTCGLATVAGAVMFIYASVLSVHLPDSLGQVVLASLMSVPASLVIARIMVPPEADETEAAPLEAEGFKYDGYLDAFMRGAQDGMGLAVNVIGAVIAFLALTTFLNIVLGDLLPNFGGAPVTLERLTGWLFSPIMWSVGIDWSEATIAGSIVGSKTILNEMIGFIYLAEAAESGLSERSQLLILFSLSGFANIGSIGVLIAGYSSLIPSRRADVVELAPLALISGTLASLMTAAVVGVLYG